MGLCVNSDTKNVTACTVQTSARDWLRSSPTLKPESRLTLTCMSAIRKANEARAWKIYINSVAKLDSRRITSNSTFYYNDLLAGRFDHIWSHLNLNAFYSSSLWNFISDNFHSLRVFLGAFQSISSIAILLLGGGGEGVSFVMARGEWIRYSGHINSASL
jgi:hypothetical protein